MGRKTSRLELGLTFIELLVVMAIAAILLGVAVPSFANLLQQTRGSSYTNAFLGAIWLTRSEAVKRNHLVTLCASSNGATCSTTGHWSQGWIVFLDANGNALRETDSSAGETLISQHEALHHGWTAQGNQNVAMYLSYTSAGESKLTGGGFQAGTIKFCPTTGHGLYATKIVINSLGRPRTEKIDTAEC